MKSAMPGSLAPSRSGDRGQRWEIPGLLYYISDHLQANPGDALELLSDRGFQTSPPRGRTLAAWELSACTSRRCPQGGTRLGWKGRGVQRRPGPAAPDPPPARRAPELAYCDLPSHEAPSRPLTPKPAPPRTEHLSPSGAQVIEAGVVPDSPPLLASHPAAVPSKHIQKLSPPPGWSKYSHLFSVLTIQRRACSWAA